MASCNNYALAGLSKSCDLNKGGVSEIFIARYDDVTGVTASTGSTTSGLSGENVITAIGMSGSTKFIKYYVRKNVAYFTSTLNVTDEGGAYVSTELFLQFSRMEAKKRTEMVALSLNDMAVIVKDANGLYWYLGKNEPVTATAGEGATGTNREDSNHYSITLTDTSDDFPYQVDPAIIESITAERVA